MIYHISSEFINVKPDVNLPIVFLFICDMDCRQSNFNDITAQQQDTQPYTENQFETKLMTSNKFCSIYTLFFCKTVSKFRGRICRYQTYLLLSVQYAFVSPLLEDILLFIHFYRIFVWLATLFLSSTVPSWARPHLLQ